MASSNSPSPGILRLYALLYQESVEISPNTYKARFVLVWELLADSPESALSIGKKMYPDYKNRLAVEEKN